MSELARLLATAPVIFCLVRGRMEPCSFMLGGKALDTKRSDPPALLIAVSSLMMWALACSSVRLDIASSRVAISWDRSEPGLFWYGSTSHCIDYSIAAALPHAPLELTGVGYRRL